MAESITISISTLFDACKTLSSLEGRTLKDGSGKSMYEIVHMQSRDEEFVKPWLRTACSALMEDCKALTTNITFATDVYTLTLVADTRIAAMSALVQFNIEQGARAYAMMHWMSDKSDARSKVHEADYIAARKALQAYGRKDTPTWAEPTETEEATEATIDTTIL